MIVRQFILQRRIAQSLQIAYSVRFDVRPSAHASFHTEGPVVIHLSQKDVQKYIELDMTDGQQAALHFIQELCAKAAKGMAADPGAIFDLEFVPHDPINDFGQGAMARHEQEL